MADRERVLRDRVDAALTSVYRVWHRCALKEPERGIAAGTLCDDCVSAITAHLADIFKADPRVGEATK